ncbi:MAG: PAS domain-containing protein, partial [Nodosilinea sp.]
MTVDSSDTSHSEDFAYQQLFRVCPEPMWVYDLETLQFLAVNDTAVERYGYSRDQFLAMTIQDIRPPEDIPALLENVAQVTAGLDFSGVWQHCLADGRIILVKITSHTLEFEGRPAEVVLAHDVT